MLFRSQGSYDLSEFKPGIFVKKYMDVIFKNAGYRYEIQDEDDQIKFDRLIIPYSGGEIGASPEDIEDFYVKGSTVSYIRGAATGTYFSLNPIAIPSATLPILATFDNLGHFNDLTHTYTNGVYTATNQFNINVKMNYRVIIKNGIGATAYLVPNAKSVTHLVQPFVLGTGATVSFQVQGAATQTNSIVTTQASPLEVPTGETTLVEDSFTWSFKNVTPFVPGATAVMNSLLLISNGTNSNWQDAPSGGSDVADMGLLFTIDSVEIEYLPNIEFLGYNNMIRMNRFVPDIKTKDFIKGIMTHFNLIGYVVQEDPFKIIFTTRENFYKNGNSLDWRKKAATNMDIQHTFLSETNGKFSRLTYKEGKDEPNTSYKSKYNEVYGQFIYKFDSDFASGENKTEVPWEPCILVQDTKTAHVLQVNGFAPKTGLRMIYYGGSRDRKSVV